MNRVWVEPDKRDQVVDFVQRWAEKTAVPIARFLEWLELSNKFYDWRQRYGQVNHHNGKVPRDFWLHDWEKQRILDFQLLYPQEGYRRLTYMMIDAGIVAVSPASVYRVLHQAGRLARFPKRNSRKGAGFQQPLQPHEHWHIDIAHINVHGTFYYLCAVLDGASRYIVDWTLREAMREPEVEILLQHAKEKFPEARPRIISDNGPQFIAKDFKEFIRISGMTHVRTSPYYPQSNGKLERWNQSIKSECIRPGVPLSLENALDLVAQYVGYYNQKRLHSVLGYVTPQDFLAGRQAAIHAERDRRLETARQQREEMRRRAREKTEKQSALDLQCAGNLPIPFMSGETEAGSAGTQPC